MSKQAPFDDSQVTALLSRISKRAAQTVRNAAAETRDTSRNLPVKSTPALLRPAGGRIRRPRPV